MLSLIIARVFCWLCIEFENSMSIQTNKWHLQEPRGVSGMFVSESHMKYKEKLLTDQ